MNIFVDGLAFEYICDHEKNDRVGRMWDATVAAEKHKLSLLLETHCCFVDDACLTMLLQRYYCKHGRVLYCMCSSLMIFDERWHAEFFVLVTISSCLCSNLTFLALIESIHPSIFIIPHTNFRCQGYQLCYQLRLPQQLRGLRPSNRSNRSSRNHRYRLHLLHRGQPKAGPRPSRHPARGQAAHRPQA